jgi:receptor protein-tyrosine kinase
MKSLLEQMRSRYDYIIIDSPPILHLADGLILSTLVDGTVLVTWAGKTTYDMFSTGLKKLHDFNPPILGVILNAQSHRTIGSQSYYYYREYYREEKSKQEKA